MQSMGIYTYFNAKEFQVKWHCMKCYRNFPKYGFVVVNLQVFGDNGSSILGPGEF